MNDQFSSSFIFEDEEVSGAKICVIGVGGGGGNAVHNMVQRGITGADFVVVNTDQQALDANSAPVRIQAGRQLTKGLGAGARPTIGMEAVDESRQEVERALEGYDMIFITAGMGGGTGTGGAPVVASIAKKLGILTVAIVTKPFRFEGNFRKRAAKQGIAALREHVDTLIVVPNDRLLEISERKATFLEAFGMADDVLYNATRGISDLITATGVVNLDFADVVTTMKDGGTALMGAATSTGEHRAAEAAKFAIKSPLLDGLSIAGARNVLVNITANVSLGIHEVDEAVSIVQQEAGEDVEVIFGTVVDDEMEDKLSVTVIATGFDKSSGGAHPAPQPAQTQTTPTLIRTTAGPLKEPDTYYKGQKNLSDLDKPAHMRRSEIPAQTQNGANSDEDPPEKKTRRVRRVTLDGTPKPDRPEKAPDGSNPAFLRRQMD